MSSTYDLNITQGSKVDITFTLTDSAGSPIDLDGYSVSGAIRFRYSDVTPLITLSPTITLPNIVVLALTSSQTVSLPVGMAVYDLERYTNAYNVQKVISGKVFISPEATV